MGNCRGSSGRTNGRYSGGGVNPDDIVSERDMIVERGERMQEVDDVLTVSRDLLDMYGNNVPLQQFMIAELKPGSQGVIGYYDGSNIAINQRFMNTAALEQAYAESVKSGFHPSNGSKSALQAVTSHEFGHAANDAVAKRMGVSLDQAADRIVAEARKQTPHRGVVQMASKISTYATQSNAEAVAEAFADVYCNGKSARKESHAIVNVLNSYLK